MTKLPAFSGVRALLHRRVLVLAGLVCVGVSGSFALAQTAAEPDAPTRPGDLADLRVGSGGALADELRREETAQKQGFSPGDDLSPDEPFGRASVDEPLRPAGPSVPVVEEDVDPLPDAEPSFDLFEGPDGRAAQPVNSAAAPAAAGGAIADPAAAPTSDRSRAAARPGGSEANDPLLEAERGDLSDRDLALPAGPIRGSRVDAAGGRLNLPVTGLRQTIPLAEDDPFAPVGVRAGRFVLYSTLEQSVGASTNLSNSSDGRAGIFSDTILSGRLISDWSTHQAELNGLAAYRRNFAGDVESEPRVALDGRLRLDVDRLTTATLRGAFAYAQEDPIDLDPLQSASDRPETFTYSAGAGIERTLGRIALRLDADAIRETTSRDDGAVTETADENVTTYTGAIRAGYEISPALQPFVQGSLGRRVFDESALDGTSRDSVIPSLRAGLAFDLGEKFAGEAAAGYAWNNPDADAVAGTGSPTIDARVAWSPKRGTDLVFSGVTSFDPDTESSETSTLYEAAVALRHRATARTDLNATLSAAYRDSDAASERETSYSAEGGFTYWLNRTLAFTGLVRHERLDGEIEGSGYTANSARVGIRLQR